MKTTFAEERARILHQHAEVLLRERTLPIETIATRLGYSNRAAFERAFLRWSGKTPHAVRSGT
jgi:AraC-like DNA-binding protein